MSDHTRSKQRQHLAEDERRVYTRFYYRRFQDLWILKGKYVYMYKSFRKDILKGTSPLWVISFPLIEYHAKIRDLIVNLFWDIYICIYF